MTRQYNAYKHGLYTEAVCLPFEDPHQFRRYVRDLMRSLDPQTALEREQARDIAHEAWRLRRLNHLLASAQDQIMQQLSPMDVAQCCDVPQGLRAKLPPWFTDMQHRIPKKMQRHARDICEEYLECRDRYASAPNLVAALKVYPLLFAEAHRYANKHYQSGIINPVSHQLDYLWQTNTPKLWKLLEELYQENYFVAYWDDLKKIARPWIEAWYFLQARRDHQYRRTEDLAQMRRQQFRKQLDAYHQGRRSQLQNIKLMRDLGIDLEFGPLRFPIEHVSILVSGVGAQGEVGQVMH